MAIINELLEKIRRKCMKLRLQPIRVFVFHQVSVEFDPSTMWKGDWTNITQFKQNILNLKKNYTFISLSEAHEKLLNDKFRLRRYAVLTSDDGWASILSVLPWLYEQNIPLTLFLNPAYLTGEETREIGMNRLLTMDQIRNISSRYSSVTIASHGWNHSNCTEQDYVAYCKNVDNSVNFLKRERGFIPFFAYPSGRHTDAQDAYLHKKNLVPVYCDGKKNYNDAKVIHRECIDCGISKRNLPVF